MGGLTAGGPALYGTISEDEMELTITKGMTEYIGKTRVEKMLGRKDDDWEWNGSMKVDLRELPSDEIKQLAKDLEPYKHVRGIGMMISDIAIWLNAVKDPTKWKVKNIRQFESILVNAIGATEHKHIFAKDPSWREAWLCYYVGKIAYHPERITERHVEPAYVSVDLFHETMDKKIERSIYFQDEDVRNLVIPTILEKNGGYVMETPALRKMYLRDLDRFKVVTNVVGKQFLAVGHGSDDMDGNKKERNDWWHNRTNSILLDPDGVPSKVVVDVFKETEEERSSRYREGQPSSYFWPGTKIRLTKEEREADVEVEDLVNIEDFSPEVPFHPFAAVFDLRRHLRLKVHTNFLTEYEYKKDLDEKLVLPEDVKNLVHLLIEKKDAAFQDIVAGKSGGAVVLLSGAPGTGKTLTAEVYAEAEQKPLYSIQASQLGLDPTELEGELLKTLARAHRWGAVMLIDEADVYVHTRGNDLQQNAVVGVFLRVLEYHSNILFLTTNRAQDVDDAICSRCVAKISYTIPTLSQQRQIWRILSDGAGIKLTDVELDKIVAVNPDLTGRDVKNLLKLAQLMASREGTPVTAKTVEYVKKFKPTN